MSITDDQFSKLLSAASSVETFIDVLSELVLNDRTYYFGRCFRSPAIQSLLSISEGMPLGSLLEVLAFGEYADLIRLRSGCSLPIVTSEATSEKMRILTFVTCSAVAVSQGVSRVSYDSVALAAGIRVDDIRGIEDLVLTAMSSELVDCRMNQRDRFIEILAVQPREVALPTDTLQFVRRIGGPSADIDFMLARLKAWYSNAKHASSDVALVGQAVEGRQRRVNEVAARRQQLSLAAHRDEVAREKERAHKNSRDDRRWMS